MKSNDVPHHSGRDTYMVIIITIIVGLPLFVFLNVITMGLFVYLTLGAIATAGLAGINYFLWGRSLMQQTEWEREEVELQDQDHLDDA